MKPDHRTISDRERTDESLRAERANADDALADRQSKAEAVADRVVRRARARADAVLVSARAEADGQVDHRAPGATAQILAAERAVQDDTLQDERNAADEVLRQQREDTAAALKRLLPLEREATDRHLLSERGLSDDAIASRDDFLGMVSHDLRDLIGAIVVTSGLLASRAAGDVDGSQVVACTERIQRYAARMNRLIGDLVDITSIDAGKLAVTATRGDAGLLISEVVDTFQTAAAARNIVLAAQVVDGTLLAEFDHGRLLQVLANLISNSIKFTPEGGRVLVRGERVAAGVRFCVSDSGPGISAGMLEAVFERFRQGAEGAGRGLGLGLHISKCIVNAHGGTIWAESGPGEGTRIYFVVPASAERRRPAAPA
jgi:signal transduction histidine kinase